MRHTKNKSTVMWIVMALAMGVLGYDAWACQDRKHRQTVSGAITESSTKYLIIPLIVGLLCGHWFWSQHSRTEKDS